MRVQTAQSPSDRTKRVGPNNGRRGLDFGYKMGPRCCLDIRVYLGRKTLVTNEKPLPQPRMEKFIIRHFILSNFVLEQNGIFSFFHFIFTLKQHVYVIGYKHKIVHHFNKQESGLLKNHKEIQCFPVKFLKFRSNKWHPVFFPIGTILCGQVGA